MEPGDAAGSSPAIVDWSALGALPPAPPLPAAPPFAAQAPPIDHTPEFVTDAATPFGAGFAPHPGVAPPGVAPVHHTMVPTGYAPPGYAPPGYAPVGYAPPGGPYAQAGALAPAPEPEPDPGSLDGPERHVARIEVLILSAAYLLPMLLNGIYGLTHHLKMDAGLFDPSRRPLMFLDAVLRSLTPGAIGAYLLWRNGRLNAAGIRRIKIGRLLWQTAAIIGALFATLIFGGIVVAVLRSLGIVQTPNHVFPDRNLSIWTVIGAFGLAASAGFGEEFAFRAYFITRYRDSGWRLAAVTVPLLFFIIGHGYQGVGGLLVIALLGAVLQSAYLLTKNIWPNAIAHTIYDFILMFPW